MKIRIRSPQLCYILFFSGVFFILLFTMLFKPFYTTNQDNCRFWGIICSEFNGALADTVRNQLDSLGDLAVNHPDGWGTGFFMRPDTEHIIAVINRGEPEAYNDPRYLRAIEQMISHAENNGIVHIRSGTTGPSGGIPDPHPFIRYSLNRDFQIILAHNGTIPIKPLLELINTVHPYYLSLNPPDYNPDYIDSDLYALYIMEIIDTYTSLSIEECIKIAITKLDSTLGLSAAKFNFVMTDGNTMWALHYDKSTTESPALYLYPNVSESYFWIAASEPLDTLNTFWAAVPNSLFVAFKPNESPRFYRIFSSDTFDFVPNIPIIDIIYQNPFHNHITIKINTNYSGGVLTIYNNVGQQVKELDIPKQDPLLPMIVTWDGKDKNQHVLPNGIYYCALSIGTEIYTEKIVLIR